MRISSLRAKEIIDSEEPETVDKVTAIYNRHIDRVYRVCLSMMGNKPDAEDAVQHVFIKLMESSMQFSDIEHEKAWLIVTARNYCRDLHRRWWKKNVVDLSSHVIEQTAADAAIDHEMEESLRGLPPTYRLVLYLHYYEGYKIAEIAAMLKLNANTVKTQLRSARKRLKLEMGDDPDE